MLDQTKRTVSITQKRNVQIPLMPNFVTIDGVSTDIADLDSEALKALADAWCVALIDHVANRRTRKQQIAYAEQR